MYPYTLLLAGLNAYDVLKSGMQPWEVTYQHNSESVKAHTGDVFPKKLVPWEPKDMIKEYFAEHAERLRSLILTGSDPRPGNTSQVQFICRTYLILNPLMLC